MQTAGEGQVRRSTLTCAHTPPPGTRPWAGAVGRGRGQGQGGICSTLLLSPHPQERNSAPASSPGTERPHVQEEVSGEPWGREGAAWPQGEGPHIVAGLPSPAG